MARLSRLEYSFRFAVSEITTLANRRGDAAQVDAAVSGRSASSYTSVAAVMRLRLARLEHSFCLGLSHTQNHANRRQFAASAPAQARLLESSSASSSVSPQASIRAGPAVAAGAAGSGRSPAASSYAAVAAVTRPGSSSRVMKINSAFLCSDDSPVVLVFPFSTALARNRADHRVGACAGAFTRVSLIRTRRRRIFVAARRGDVCVSDLRRENRQPPRRQSSIAATAAGLAMLGEEP